MPVFTLDCIKDETMKTKPFICFAALLICSLLAAQPNCNAVSSGFIPISDLGTGTFTNAWNQSWVGGLYPNGSNILPQNHKSQGLQMVSQVIPRSANGSPDPVNGKIGWLSIGMSNTTQETQKFIPTASAFPNINPFLVLVDGAQGGQTASIISSPWHPNYATFWNTVANRLSSAGISSHQVQVIWFKEADQASKYNSVQAYYDSLMIMIPRSLNELKSRFPNAVLCYMASRISARYATTALNPEPYSYYTGWAVKHVIEQQINNDPKLQFNGTSPNSPWLSWGIYMWSDGNTPQSSNTKIFWSCPGDFQSDGTHPSSSGAQKVADLLLDFFSTDSTATPWFLYAGNPTSLPSKESNTISHKLFPNPFRDSFTIEISNGLFVSGCSLTLFDCTGRKIKQLEVHRPVETFHLSGLEGLFHYILQLPDGSTSCGKISALK
jgi:hypothetical protein